MPKVTLRNRSERAVHGRVSFADNLYRRVVTNNGCSCSQVVFRGFLDYHSPTECLQPKQLKHRRRRIKKLNLIDGEKLKFVTIRWSMASFTLKTVSPTVRALISSV
jgi:hypothetical protein